MKARRLCLQKHLQSEWKQLLHLTNNDIYPQWHLDKRHVKKVQTLSHKFFGVKKTKYILKHPCQRQPLLIRTDLEPIATYLNTTVDQLKNQLKRKDCIHIGSYTITKRRAT